MSSLESVVKKYAVENYGDLIVPGKPTFDEDTKVWESQLRSTYPRIIEDEKSNEIVVRFLDFRDLGTIRLNDKFQIIEATPNENCEHQLISRLVLWKQQAEKIVVTASSDVFAKIAESVHVLNPLRLVLGEITKLDKHKIRILEEEIDEQRRPLKIRQYLELLTELDIVRKDQYGYSYGNTYVGLLEKAGNEPRELQTILLSYVIRRKYSTLRHVFDIRQLEPFVHLANTYYWPSLDAEKLIHTTRKNLYQRYEDYYGRITTWQFNSNLSELTAHGALQYENGYLIGNKEQFDSMLELKQPELLNP